MKTIVINWRYVEKAKELDVGYKALAAMLAILSVCELDENGIVTAPIDYEGGSSSCEME